MAYRKQLMVVDTSAWFPIVVPFDATGFTIKNIDIDHALYIRTDIADAAQQDTIGPGGQEVVAAGPLNENATSVSYIFGPGCRFLAGQTYFWLQGTKVFPGQNVMITWIK